MFLQCSKPHVRKKRSAWETLAVCSDWVLYASSRTWGVSPKPLPHLLFRSVSHDVRQHIAKDFSSWEFTRKNDSTFESHGLASISHVTWGEDIFATCQRISLTDCVGSWCPHVRCWAWSKGKWAAVSGSFSKVCPSCKFHESQVTEQLHIPGLCAGCLADLEKGLMSGTPFLICLRNGS